MRIGLSNTQGTLILVITPFFLVLSILSNYYYTQQQAKQFDAAKTYFEEQIASTTLALQSAEMRLAYVDSSITDSLAIIEQNLSLTKEESQAVAEALERTLSAEQIKVAQLLEDTEKIGGAVGTLEKLSQTDPELLQKYSKVFFLNEHYVPAELSEITNAYLYSEKETQFIHSAVFPKLIQMIDDAAALDVPLYIKSAYRSFNNQNIVKTSYSVTYGEESANQFSADQGYSEHQLGTTIDLITTGLGGQLNGFGGTGAYVWLQQNAHTYGFTLSYPENNTFYIYEPWHWRFVGVELATKLVEEGKFFYDLEQREIDEYLVNIFD